MTFALLGVFVMQLYYIQESYKLKSELFDQNVSSALNAVINKVQKQNAFLKINKKDFELRKEKERGIKSQTDTIVSFKVRYKESENLRKFKQQQEVIDYLNFQDSIIRETYFNPQIISEEQFRTYSNKSTDNSRKLSLEVVDIKDKKTGNLIGRTLRQRPVQGSELNPNKDRLPDTIRYLAYSPVNMFPQLISFPSIDPDLIAKFKIEDAKSERKYEIELNRLYADTLSLYDESLSLVQDVVTEMGDPNIPLEKRLPSKAYLDTLIAKELLNKNITLNYQYWLTSLKDRQKVIYKNVAKVDYTPGDTYELPLFSNDILRDPGLLYVSFPNKNSAILRNLLATMASSAALLLILIFIFAYTIFAIIKQKKLTEMKTDFINNMTHEFKTPVSTIMIASEALKDPEVVHDAKRVGKLAGIIYDENVRLGDHIERVLNVARLEKKELELEQQTVDVNELVIAVIDSMDLQLQRKGAVITLDLAAEQAKVIGDELHLSNVIYNLIDNANKYSYNQPQITITTKNNNKHLSLSISDRGIGITKEQSKRIFDQFYRVPTGNLHDVKGFGLGLNYVQDIVAKMGGSIKVQSEKDKGTTFEVILPFKQIN